MYISELFETTAPNLNLLIDLADIFMYEYEQDKPELSNGYTLYELTNPFYKHKNRIEKFTDDSRILDVVYSMNFEIDLGGYSFKDGDNQSKALATYNKRNNVITFYSPSAITKSILVHELRHAIQYATFDAEKTRKNKDGSYKDYRDQHIELDAYWTDHVISHIEFGIPETKKDITNSAHRIVHKLSKTIPNMSVKAKKHYFRKTIKGLVDLNKLYHQGYEFDVDNLTELSKVLNKSDEMQALINRLTSSQDDNEADYVMKNIDKLSKKKMLSLSKVPNYDKDKEPSYAINELSPPDTLLPRNMSIFNLSTAMLYITLADRIDIADALYKAIRNTPKHDGVDLHDIILTASSLAKDEDNEMAIQEFMVKKLRHLF